MIYHQIKNSSLRVFYILVIGTYSQVTDTV